MCLGSLKKDIGTWREMGFGMTCRETRGGMEGDIFGGEDLTFSAGRRIYIYFVVYFVRIWGLVHGCFLAVGSGFGEDDEWFLLFFSSDKPERETGSKRCLSCI